MADMDGRARGKRAARHSQSARVSTVTDFWRKHFFSQNLKIRIELVGEEGEERKKERRKRKGKRKITCCAHYYGACM